MSGSQIHDGRRNKKWRDAAGPAFHQLPVFAFNDVESADAGGYVDANLIEIGLFGGPVRGLDGEVGSSQSDLDEAAHFLEFFFLNPQKGIEVLHFAGDFAVKIGGIEKRNGADAALAGEEVFPCLLRTDAQRTDQSNARNYYPASQNSTLP
jgi:hypothetical protein